MTSSRVFGKFQRFQLVPVANKDGHEGQDELGDVGKGPVQGAGQSGPALGANDPVVTVVGDGHVPGVGGGEAQGGQVDPEGQTNGGLALQSGTMGLHDGNAAVDSDAGQSQSGHVDGDPLRKRGVEGIKEAIQLWLD